MVFRRDVPPRVAGNRSRGAGASLMRLLCRITVGIILVSAVPAAAPAEVKFGILPRLGPVELFTMFNPLAQYLTKETGEKVSIVIPKDFAAFNAAVRQRQIDLGFANPVVYVQLKKDIVLEPLALAAELKAGTKFRGIIITRKESPVRRLQDLKGKKLVFVDRDSAAGYIFQMLLLHHAGFDVRRDFTVLPFAKTHDNVVQAVYNGAADAGGIREDDFDRVKRKIDISRLRIVAYTDYYPNWPVFAAPSLSKEMTAKIRAALLRLKPNEAASAGILWSAGLIGFSMVQDTDYDHLREAAQVAGAF